MPADTNSPLLSRTDELVAGAESGFLFCMCDCSGHDHQDVLSLGAFAYIGLRNSDGTPKPAVDVWDGFRTLR